MEDNKNIVTTLIEQHRTLKKEVGAVVDILENSQNPDTEVITQGLKQFKKDLTEHLKLENEVFYVELLAQMKEKGQDTTKTETFIEEMKGIGKVVYSFLEKYQNDKLISEKLSEFKEEFLSIVETLALRIESEEAGVFSYWGLF